MTISKKKKIAASDFNPKSLLGKPTDVQRLVLGTVGGIATGVALSESPTGEVFHGLRGQFRFQDQDGDILIAPVLWLPTGFDDDIKDKLSEKISENGEVIEPEASEIQFVYEIGVIRAGNPAGYSWFATPLLNVIEAEKADPVALLFASARNETPMLAAPEPAPEAPALAASEKAHAKAK